MVIHFFRNRNEERIDFFELVDNYFGSMDNCHVSSSDEVVELKFDYPEFDFSYQYLITKRTRVSSMYRLNSQFVNINLLVEIPPILPQYLIKVILMQMADLCDKFNLSIYHDAIDNIAEFNMYELLGTLIKERDNYLDNHHEIKKYYISSDRLNQIFKYQSKLEVLPSLIKADVIAAPYRPMVNELTGNVEFSINYPVGQPFIFPQHLTYVQLEEEENLISLIKADVFFKYTEKFMYEVKDSTCDVKLLFINEKNSLKIKKLLRKLRKFMISSNNFKPIEMTELIEEGGKIDEN